MQLAWATDVHLNFLSEDALRAFHERLRATNADAIVLTGDIAEAPSLERHLEALASALQRPIHFVLGNHDCYHGSIAEVRALATTMTARSRWLRWLPAVGVVPLTETTALVGHDGWADARAGDWEKSSVYLNDYRLIEELAWRERDELRDRLRALGDAAAEYTRRVLGEAFARHRRVIFATHVPPFREACWHEGEISNDDWLPHFTCVAVGEALRDVLRARPDRELVALCGHTHGSGTAQLLPNLLVRTGGAEYGSPAIADVLTV